MQIREILSNFHIGFASGWDIFIILIFFIAIFVYGLFLGRNRMIILLLSSYFSLAIVQVLPWEKLSSIGWLGVSQEPSGSLKILIFLVIILLFFFLIPRSVLSSSLRIKKRGDSSWMQLLILSIVQVGMLAMVILSFLPGKEMENIGPIIKKLFIGPGAQFIWIALPIVAVVLMRRKKKIED
ncbi:MAG: hypothetical protein ABIC36_02705 [bacterium]